MAWAKPKGKKPLPQKPPLLVRTITVTQDDQETLDRPSKDLTDYTGRTVSGAAVVRALIRHTSLHPYDWGLSQLSSIVEEGINAAVLWGRKK
jgi:hypothetical protein